MSSETREELIRAALSWFRQKKPAAYTSADHLANPQVNCVTKREQRLANACADHLRSVKKVTT